jgi:ubiquinone/menaquinone biosynthesis C-methylase UbiE
MLPRPVYLHRPVYLRRLYLFLTELLYHQLAWSYDLVATLVSAGHWKDWVLSILPDLTGDRILELGHGPGHLQSALLKQGITAVGLDKSPQMSKRAYRRIQKLDPSLVQGDAFHLPFAKETFDRVVATFPTNYITARETLTEIFRVLQPGGGMIVVPGARLAAPRGVAERFAAGIFRLFGLSQDWTILAHNWFVVPIQKAGFEVIVERRPFKSSEIFVITGKKPDGNSNRRF